MISEIDAERKNSKHRQDPWHILVRLGRQSANEILSRTKCLQHGRFRGCYNSRVANVVSSTLLNQRGFELV
ncbi:hypothetical protein V2G26_002934 [Clonostachys chloroleuca]